MRVALNMLDGPGTGIIRYTKNLLLALGAQPEAQVHAFAFGKRDPRPAWLPGSVRYHPTVFPGKVQWWLQRTLPIEAAFNLGGMDLVHNIHQHRLCTRSPSVLTVYDVSWRKLGAKNYNLVNLGWVAEAEQAIRSAHHICSISHTTANDLIAGGVPPEKITVTHLGVDERFRSIGEAAVEAVLEKYALRLPFLLFTGHVNVRKNLPVVVRALAGMELPLVLCGPPPQEGLEYWGLSGPLFRHLGYVEEQDMPALIAAASALVFPSVDEGFGLPLLEAMAAGTPVLASDIPVFREVGSSVPLYFAPHDDRQLRLLFERLLANAVLRTELRAAGRERAAEFTWERCGKATLAAYRLALGAA